MRFIATATSVFLLFFAPLSLQGQGVVTGQVQTVELGQPLPAVQVFIAELDLGVVTQPNGSYSLQNVPAGTHTLVAERIGYRTVSQQVTVGANQTVVVNFDLVAAALQLDEVVVTGTPGGTQRRAIGNAVERLDAAALVEVRPVSHVEDMLGTRLPGVMLLSGGGGGLAGLDAGAIRIRGSQSVGLANDPIVFVDGIRMNSDHSLEAGGSRTSGTISRLNDINPNDIESIEVIKGPAAATLYGTEASNGVIQIITKRGQAGAVRFDATAELGTVWFRNPLEELPTNFGTHPTTGQVLSHHLYQQELDLGNGPIFDYGLLQRYNISAQGGSDVFRYFASINRNNDSGILPTSWDRRTRSRVALTVVASDQLTLDLDASYLSGETGKAGNIYSDIVAGSAASSAYAGGLDSFRRGFKSRPPEEWHSGLRDIVEVHRNTWSLQANYQPRDWFTSRAVVGTDFTDQVNNDLIFRQENFPAGTWGSTGRGQIDVRREETQNLTVDYAGTVSLALTDRINSATSVGFQYYRKQLVTTEASGEEFVSRPLTTLSAAASTESDGDFLENSTVGLYVQQQFDLDQRIFLTAALRGDDNSAFGTDYDAAYYPKVSATWVLSEEPFWDFDLVNQFRLRGAWGAAGRQPDVFAAQRLYTSVAGVGDRPVLTPAEFGNADLGPERGEELELGFDATLWDERVEVTYTRYQRTTKDAIVRRPVAPSAGFPGSQFVNVGQLSSWGNELSVGTELVRREGISGRLDVVFATMENRVDDLGEGLDRLAFRRTRYAVEGFPLTGQHERMVVNAEFVSGNSGALKNVLCDGGIASGGGYLPGGPAVDCSDAPLVYYGRNAEPTWQLTVTPSLQIGDVYLYANISALGGHMITREDINARMTSWRNTEVANTLENPIAQAHRGGQGIARGPLGFYNAGFARLREVGAQYVFPGAVAELIGASRASVAVSAGNLALLWQESKKTLISDYPIGDPERPKWWAEDQPGAVSAGVMPPPGTLTLKLNASF